MAATGTAARKTAARKTANRRAKTKRFEHEGREYVVLESALDVEVLELVEDGQIITALRQLLEPSQWADFKDSVRDADGKVPLESLEGLMQAIVDSLQAGNS